MTVDKDEKLRKIRKAVIREAQVEPVAANPKSNKIGMIVTGCLLAILVIAGIYWTLSDHEPKILTDAEKFEKEYEAYNNKKPDGLDKNYPNMDINPENPIIYTSYDEIFKILENGTGVIYFGYPTCPWCRGLVPTLIDAAKEVGIDKIYYLNASGDRDEKKLENGKVVTTKDGSEEYKKLLDKLKNILGPYEGLKNDSIKRLYFPTVIIVKDGKIVENHIGTLDEQKDAFVELTTDQKNKLKKELSEKMNSMISCDNAC